MTKKHKKYKITSNGMKKFLFIFTILFFTLFFIEKADAASILVSPPSAIYTGDNFEVLISIDSDGVPINSVDITLNYDENLMSFSGYKSENTITPLWLVSPHESNGSILMSGIIPGGVSGLYDPRNKGLSPIPLVKLLFSATKDGNAKLSFIETKILKNDGKGTELLHDSKNVNLEIRKSITKDGNFDRQENVFDKNSPEPFTITFLESSLFSRTPSMIIFDARDAGSGIKYYQIKIGFQDWQNAQSPQPVSKSIFSRDVVVRAYDFYSNFQDASIRIPGLLSFKLLLIIFAVLVFSGILGLKLLKYRA